MNPKIVIAGVIAAFAIILGIIGFSGSTILDDVSGGNIFSPSETSREIFPIEIELDDISILEVTDDYATIEVRYKISNPNYKAVILQMIKYELYENDIRVHISQIGERGGGALVESSDYFTILREQPTIIKDKIIIKNTGKLPQFWAALNNNSPQWKIRGEAFFNLSSITAGGENEITFEFSK
jgi:hypothetical protein